MEKQNKPAIRFKGFTDAWEQRKVGEVSESYSGGTPSVGVKEYYGGQIPFIRSAEINSEITELFLTEEGLKNSSARLVAVGDILYALYGATSGEVGRARLKGAINQAILAIKPHTDYDSEYLAQWLRKSKHSIIDTYLQGGQGNLSGTIVKELSVDFPSLKEQKAIGGFFRQLDNLITLHQRKYDKLQVLKKAMLEKMFPKNGSSVPEIRFKGFTDAWEQRKLGEFFEKYQNTVYLQDEEEYRQISIRNTGVVEYRCTNKGKNIGRKRQYLIDTDTHPVTLTFTRQTVYEGGIGFVPKELNGAIVTENMPLLEMTNASQDFMKALFNTSGYYKSVINDDTLIGSAQKALHEKQWLDSYVCIPVLDEQKQIGSFFQQLEHLITLHQRELEKLQNIKKSMLEKMFV